jgi:hypothetical protein
MAPHSGSRSTETGLEGPPEDVAKKIREQHRKQQPCPYGEAHVYRQLEGPNGKSAVDSRREEDPTDGRNWRYFRWWFFCVRCGRTTWWDTKDDCPF